MAPKRTARTTDSEGSAKKKSKTKEVEHTGSTSADDDQDEQQEDMSKIQRNFITTLSNIKDDDPNKIQKQEALIKYRNLPLRSSKKHELLKVWSKDKSCSWVNQFVEKTNYTESRDEVMSDGWGTKSFVCI